MKHIEVMRKQCKKIEIEIFDKWLISLDHITYVHLVKPGKIILCAMSE